MAQADFLNALAGNAAPTQGGNFLTALAKAPPPAKATAQPTGPSALSRAGALAGGFNKGVTDLLGLPVDTAVNVTNLGKSAAEGAMLALGKTPPTWLDPTRPNQLGQVPLSSAWLAAQLNRTPLGNVTGNPNPNDTASWILHGAGRLGAGSLVPAQGAEEAIARRGEQALKRIAEPESAGLTPAQQAAAQGGKSLGMRLTPGQESGSKPLQQLETWAESHPWTSGPLARLKASNQEVLNRTAADSIGENSKVVDANTLGEAADRMGNVFNSVRSGEQSLPIDAPKIQAFLQQLDADTTGLLPGGASVLDHPLVRTFTGLATPNDEGAATATAKQLGSLSSKLSRASYKEMTGQSGDRDLGLALGQLKDHVDDLLESNLTGEGKEAYAKARGEYRNLMHLVSRGNVVNPSSGNVNGVALAARLQKADRPGFLYGKNQSPLYQVARFAQAFKPIVGDSGTATRLGNPFDPMEWLTGIPANLASRAYLSMPGSAVMRAAARGAGGTTKALPLATRRLLANPVLTSGLTVQR